MVQHNVSDENTDPAGTARALAGTDADLIALEELTAPALPAYEEALAAGLPLPRGRGHRRALVEHPLTGSGRWTSGPRESGRLDRGLRARSGPRTGDVAVYVAHLPSVRIGRRGLSSGRRDESAALLGAAVAAEDWTGWSCWATSTAPSTTAVWPRSPPG